MALDAIHEGHLTGNGVHWALEDDWDLNVNLAHLDPGSTVAAHINYALDVAIVVLHGTGHVRVDSATRPLAPHTIAVVPRGTERSIHAGDQGLTYLTVHRRYGPLTIGPNRASHG